jgi:hypothetical protein
VKSNLIAFIIGPQEIAYVIFERQQLLFWEVRTFPSGIDIESLEAGFRFERFNVTAAVLPAKCAEETRPTHEALCSVLRKRGIPIFEISDKDLRESFGLPALKDRQELLRVSAAMFPQVPFGRFTHACLEAAALGLFFETNRLLTINTPLE